MPYDVETRSDFFVGAAGASAALTINRDPILAIDGLADRAFQTVLLLLGVVTISLLGGVGLYWTMAGILLTLIGAVVSAWVLTIGVRR